MHGLPKAHPPSVAAKPGIQGMWSMREEIVTAVRYNPILGREVVVRLTYTVGEGPRPDIVRRFLVKEQVERSQDSQSLICQDDASKADLNKERGAAPRLRPEGLLGPPSTR
jgi:hypothetical protein